MIELSKANSKLIINPTGGRIVSLALRNVSILGTFQRLDGKEASTHVCVPNFNKEGVEKYSLPSHGPARSVEWTISDQSETFLSLQYDIPKTGTYPTILRINQEFTLTESEFFHDVFVTNLGDSEAPLNIGLHYYWHSPKDWEEAKLNGVDISEQIKKDTSMILKDTNEINLPGMPPVTMKVERFAYAQVWTGRKGEGETMEYNKDFLCIEPIRGIGDYFGSSDSIIPPEKTTSSSVAISV